jgi:hypothetical protein
MRQDHLIVNATFDKVFGKGSFDNFSKPGFEKHPALYLKLIENKDTAILFIDRVGFSPELKEKTNAMIKELVRLLFEEFYPRSHYWQKSNETWKKKTRKWGKDFAECIRAYLEGRSPALLIPPVMCPYKGTKVFLAVGTVTILKMENKLVLEFIRKAMPVIKRYASEFRFIIISSYRGRRFRKLQDIDKVAELWG